MASTLLGMRPPRLPGRILVRSGELFGIAEDHSGGAQPHAGDGASWWPWTAYELAVICSSRQARQDQSRVGRTGEWDGRWGMAVVERGQRPAATGEALRGPPQALRLAELREGVWLRPANLDPARSRRPSEWPLSAEPLPDVGEDAAGLAAGLWDLDGWATEAERLRTEMALVAALEARRPDRAGAWVRRGGGRPPPLPADPLLPSELLPAGWPGDASGPSTTGTTTPTGASGAVGIRAVA